MFPRQEGRAFAMGGLTRQLARAFPPPHFLIPRAVGIDISDASIKWMTLSGGGGVSRQVEAYGEHPVPEGVVVSGAIKDAHALARVLKEIRPHLGGVFSAHAALPEEPAYVFSMRVPDGSAHEQVISMIEFEFQDRVPIPPSQAVYDYTSIGEVEGQEREIGVTVFPRDLAESYASVFAEAGIVLLSLEIEARSIARAVSSKSSSEPVTLLVDFGRARSGFAVLKRGIPIFTSTVEVGGDMLTRAATQALSVSPEEAQTFRNEEGLLATDATKKAAFEAMVPTASALSDEVLRHFHFWDTRRNERGERVTPVEKILLVGGSANLNGLPEYIAGRVRTDVEIGNVWRNACNFDEYIPPIDRRTSLQYATAAGLALRSG